MYRHKMQCIVLSKRKNEIIDIKYASRVIHKIRKSAKDAQSIIWH